MKTFYNTSLFTGYLKQLLHDFNLPSYRIYTKQNRDYFDRYGKEDDTIIETVVAKQNENHIRYVPYIKDGFIQEYVDGRWEKRGAVGKRGEEDNLNVHKGAHVHFYDDGMRILNHTKNLEIKDNVYDSYTHEYLGEYLRFLRDYKNVDLMPLYNCFSDRAANNINLKFSITRMTQNESGEESKDTVDCKFYNDDLYKLCVVPVKLFKNYTIAIDSAQPIEVCCVIYDKTLDARISKGKFESLPGLTYQKIRDCSFSAPFLYDKLSSRDIIDLTKSNNNAELAQSESCLKLLIKLPKTNTSTIVILEGDYRGWNDSKLVHVGEKWKTVTNHAVINKDHIVDDIPFSLVTPLQLLRFNTGKQHPYADKLESYLLGNVISELDDIPNNIKRVQKVMKLNGYEFSYEGLWTDGIREVMYDFINNNHNNFETNHDILGYVDRDVERYYYACVNHRDINGNIVWKEKDSLLTVELEEDR